MSSFLLFVGLVLFIALVVIHEMGHFIVARRNGVVAEEFGIGIPPRIWKKQMKNGWKLSLNLLPLGGFVKLKGEHDNDTRPGSFGAATLWVKTKILMAGVFMNLLAALILFTIIAGAGMPNVITKDNVGEDQFTVKSDTRVIKDVSNKDVVLVGQVEGRSPAEKLGIQPDDRIRSVAGMPITDSEELRAQTQSHAGQTVDVAFDHNGQTKQGSAQLNNTSPYLGVSTYSGATGVQLRRSTWSAPIVAVGLSVQVTRLTFKGISSALKGAGTWAIGVLTRNKPASQAGEQAATQQLSGPLGIFYVLKAATAEGFIFVLFIIAILSLTLAIMNILPIPALDGGRLYLITWYRKVIRRPLKIHIEERIIGTSFAALLLLFVLITIVDFRRFH